MESETSKTGQADPAELAGGLLGSLARGWLTGPVRLERLLADLGRELGAESVAWLGDKADGGVGWPHHRPRDVDWALASRVGGAEVHLVGAEDRLRFPRLAAGAGREFYVRTGPHAPTQGVLRVVCGRVLPLGRAGLVALAELVAGMARVSAQAAEAESANRERLLGQHAASLFHDLRNQLTLAQLELERLRGGPPSTGGLDGLQDVLAGAREMCVRALDGGVARAPRPFALRAVLVEEAGAAMAVSRGAASVQVQARCPAGLQAQCDPALVRRLVRNLVSNACEASGDGGAVRVEGVALGEGRAAIVVEDQGHGMDRVRIDGLLAPRRSGGRGTGYGGVSLVECLRQLGGECTVESGPGQGTRVEVRLPGAAPGARPAVLVLDPDSERRRRRCASAAAGGQAVIGVADPSEGLRALRSTEVAEVVVARGACGPGLEELLTCARSAGARVEQLPSGS